VVALSNGRVFMIDPGISPQGVVSTRGITRFPVLYAIDLVGGIPGATIVAGCSSTKFSLEIPLPNCGGASPDPLKPRGGGNFYFPSGATVRSELPELELLVADSGQPHSSCTSTTDPTSGRCRQSVFSVFPDEPYVPRVNDRAFCPA